MCDFITHISLNHTNSAHYWTDVRRGLELPPERIFLFGHPVCKVNGYPAVEHFPQKPAPILHDFTSPQEAYNSAPAAQKVS